jgi:hypothetical protein
MATMALPIQTLSADIQQEAACAQKQIVRLQPRQRHTLARFRQMWLIHYYCGKAITAGERLISTLQCADFNYSTSAQLEELATDLDRIVSLTRAVVEKGHETQVNFGQSLHQKFDKLEELAGHFDSFAESLHVAADAHCESMLAFAVAEQTLIPTAV